LSVTRGGRGANKEDGEQRRDDMGSHSSLQGDQIA
jgi:hypothetical protein